MNEVYLVLFTIVFLIVGLYKNFLNPSLLFLIVVLTLIIIGTLKTEQFLLGLANKQVIIIFSLMFLTTGIRKGLGNEFFLKIFKKNLDPGQFRLKMMMISASVSSILNNTPVVAFMIPYVKSWAEEQNYPASKFLIPLSFATILGGMITMVGTSTNLLLNGLLAQQGLELLKFTDFFFLGSLVAFFGIAYLAIFSEKLLPDRIGNREKVIAEINEYIVETVIVENSLLIGKTIQEAGLRHLKELFLVEIRRGNRVITAVDPNRLLQVGDHLYFAGNTQAILRLINEKNGLEIPEVSYISKNKFYELSEGIIPTGSSLIGETLKSSNFRDTYKGSVISIYRNNTKVSGNLGEIRLMAGDLLLLLINENNDNLEYLKDLILIQRKGIVKKKMSDKNKIILISSLFLLILGIIGVIDLFIAVFFGILVQVLGKSNSLQSIKKALDLDLLIILISALGIGSAIQSSGTADFLVQVIFGWNHNLPIWSIITILFFITILLTSLITNAAAVTIMFPIAYQLSEIQSSDPTGFFVAIAFAASADFITPIGYQTNLMVMGPGNYTFSDYTKIGLPLTLIYSIISICFILTYYQL